MWQSTELMSQYLLKGILKQCFSGHCNLYVLWHGQLLKYKNYLSQLSPLKWPIKKTKQEVVLYLCLQEQTIHMNLYLIRVNKCSCENSC